MLQRAVNARQPAANTLDELSRAVQGEWDRLEQNTLRRLILISTVFRSAIGDLSMAETQCCLALAWYAVKPSDRSESRSKHTRG